MKLLNRMMMTAGAALTFTAASPAAADPCGMVPPLWEGQGPAITRVGEQRTYVMFKDGVETFVIRPGFSGKVDNFGMLIPFPSPPAIRKVPDEIFDHIAAAVDPPEVEVNLCPVPDYDDMRVYSSMAEESGAGDGGLEFEAVRVLKQEAVGMYEVAVLEAGSAKALERWMDQHGYKYPNGMDGPVTDYVKMRWAFVAVKSRVGNKQAVTPKPGMRQANPALPAGATFDGQVQAMGFRFKVEKPVVPMRLSAFNEGELHNIVYYMAKGPVRILGIDSRLVVRQISGGDLFSNVTQPLPLLIHCGDIGDISQKELDRLQPQRNPEPHNGHARALFASDLMAVRTGKLALPFEEMEKVLLRISEGLNLRGGVIDGLHGKALEKERKAAVRGALGGLQGMTLSLVDGDFPREYLRDNNLTFSRFQMSGAKNDAEKYNARMMGPRSLGDGKIYRGKKSKKPWWKFW